MTENEKNDDFINNIENPEIAKRQQMMVDLNIKHTEEKDNVKQKNTRSFDEKMEDLKAKDNVPSSTNNVESNVTKVERGEPTVDANYREDPEFMDDEDFFKNMEASIVNEVNETKEKVEEKKKEESKPIPVVEELQPVKKVTKKKEKTVDIISPEAAEKLKGKKKQSEAKSNVKNTIDDFDDLDKKVEIANTEAFENSRVVNDDVEELTVEKINKTIDDIYSDDGTTELPTTDVKVEIVNPESENEQETKTTSKKKDTKERTVKYYGGDGEVTAFKSRVSKNAKILRNINIKDTSSISSVGIEAKTAQDRQKIYLNTVFPTLQPSIVVVPMIISGVVISMSAFSWPDIKEICLIEEKLSELDPEDPDYIYDKNKNFIEKRKKQLQLFYKHITAVSGYAEKPSYDELFNKILKFPDFQQLFFAAYATTSQSKEHRFNIACGSCGTDNFVQAKPKDLCFLLNTNININKLTYYIEKGSTLDTSESAKIYKEFQSEKIVEMANNTYRTKKALPNSAFIYDLKIPTIGEALTAMEDIIEIFKDKDLSHTDEYTGQTTYIDSSFGLPPDLVELKNYLYFNKLIVADIVDEDKENNSVKVSYVHFDDKNAIYNSIQNLSPADYRTLITDETLQKLVRVTGIRHAIKGGICSEPTCRAELGNVSVEPETLFFMIAQEELIY